MKPFKISCEKCGRKVIDNFDAKMEHAITWHPLETAMQVFGKLLKSNPADIARDAGRRLSCGDKLKSGNS